MVKRGSGYGWDQSASIVNPALVNTSGVKHVHP